MTAISMISAVKFQSFRLNRNQNGGSIWINDQKTKECHNYPCSPFTSALGELEKLQYFISGWLSQSRITLLSIINKRQTLTTIVTSQELAMNKKGKLIFKSQLPFQLHLAISAHKTKTKCKAERH